MRWGWIGLAIVTTIGYLWLNPPIIIVRLEDEEDEDRTEPEKDNGAGGLGDEEVDEGDVLVDAVPEDDIAAEAPGA